MGREKLCKELGTTLATLDRFEQHILDHAPDNLSRDIWLTLRREADEAITARTFVDFVRGRILDAWHDDDTESAHRVIMICDDEIKALVRLQVESEAIALKYPARGRVARAIACQEIHARLIAAHRVRSHAAEILATPHRKPMS